MLQIITQKIVSTITQFFSNKTHNNELLELIFWQLWIVILVLYCFLKPIFLFIFLNNVIFNITYIISFFITLLYTIYIGLIKLLIISIFSGIKLVLLVIFYKFYFISLNIINFIFINNIDMIKSWLNIIFILLNNFFININILFNINNNLCILIVLYVLLFLNIIYYLNTYSLIYGNFFNKIYFLENFQKFLKFYKWFF